MNNERQITLPLEAFGHEEQLPMAVVSGEYPDIQGREHPLVENLTNLWELSREQTHYLDGATAFIDDCTERFQKQFWELVQKDVAEKGYPTKRVLDYIKKMDWDKPSFKIMVSSDAKKFVAEHELSPEVLEEDRLVVSLELPKQLEQYHKRGILTTEELHDLEVPLDKKSSGQDIQGMAIEWGRYYQACHQQIWHSLQYTGADKEMFFNRINPKGTHKKDAYYYIFELHDGADYIEGSMLKEQEMDIVSASISLGPDNRQAYNLAHALQEELEYGNLPKAEQLYEALKEELNLTDEGVDAIVTEKQHLEDLYGGGSDRYRLLTSETATPPNIALESHESDLAEFLNARDLRVLEFYDPKKRELFNVLSISVSDTGLPKLPRGYVYTGGAARSVLSSELGEAPLPIRDLDITTIEEFGPDVSHVEEIGRKLMPDDYKHGYGVGGLKVNGKVIFGEDMGEYFKTRDFTLNEIFVTGTRAYMTLDGLRALNRKEIVPSEMEQTNWWYHSQETPGVPAKLVMKATFEHIYKQGQVSGIEDWQFSFENIPPFFIALQLERAQEQGDRIAELFFKELKRRGTVTSSHDSVYQSHLTASTKEQLGLNIRMHMEEDGRTPFEFTEEALNTGVITPDMSELEMYEKYLDLAESHYGRSRDLPTPV